MFKGKTRVHRISFERAKGGLVSSAEHRTYRGGQGGGPEYDYDEEKTVHPTMEHAKAHLDSMADCFDDKDS